MDPINRIIRFNSQRPSISYDILSINIGITPKIGFDIRKDDTSITLVKPIDGFARKWETILNRTVSNPSHEDLRIAVVGGGAGGCELSLCIHHRLKSELSRVGRTNHHVKVVLVNRGQSLMKGHCK